MGLLSSIGKAIGSVVDFGQTYIAPNLPGGDGLGALVTAGEKLFGSKPLSERQQMAAQSGYNEYTLRNSLQWRAEDAQKAGISKLYGIGAPAVSFQPSSNFNGVQGQSIGRAYEAYADRKERNLIFQQEARLNEEKIKSAQIANDLAASDLAVRRSGATVPISGRSGLFVDGQGDVSRQASQYTAAHKGRDYREKAPPSPAVKEFVNADGTVSLWPSQDAKNAIEDSPYEYEHMYRNRILPWVADKFYNAVYEPISGFHGRTRRKRYKYEGR